MAQIITAWVRFITAWVRWNQQKQKLNVKPLLFCKNPRVAGTLVTAIVYGVKRYQVDSIETLIPLLYSLNNREAAEAFTPNQQVTLRQIATNPYWQKREPDLVGAVLVALVALDDDKSRQTLENLAKRPWSASDLVSVRKMDW